MALGARREDAGFSDAVMLERFAGAGTSWPSARRRETGRGGVESEEEARGTRHAARKEREERRAALVLRRAAQLGGRGPLRARRRRAALPAAHHPRAPRRERGEHRPDASRVEARRAHGADRARLGAGARARRAAARGGARARRGRRGRAVPRVLVPAHARDAERRARRRRLAEPRARARDRGAAPARAGVWDVPGRARDRGDDGGAAADRRVLLPVPRRRERRRRARPRARPRRGPAPPLPPARVARARRHAPEDGRDRHARPHRAPLPDEVVPPLGAAGVRRAPRDGSPFLAPSDRVL